MAFPDGWGRRHKITIANTEVDGSSALTDYPMLVTLDHLDTEVVDAGSNSALNGGGDLRFSSDLAGASQLACEVVDFVTNVTAGSRKCEVYVSVPSVSASVDTDIYVWYKKTGEVQPAVTNVYGRNAVWANYEVVCHDGGPTDSTGNTTPVKTGSPTTTTGKFTSATNYGLDSDLWWYESTVVNSSVFSMQVWAYIDNTSVTTKGQGALALLQNSGDRAVLAADNSPNEWGNWDDQNSWLRYGQAQELDVWRSAAVVVNNTVDRRGYYEGAKLATESAINLTDIAKTKFRMGEAGQGAETWDGLLCEARLTYLALSDDWISTEYSNQTSPAAFASAGTPVSVGAINNDLVSAMHFQRHYEPIAMGE